MRPPSSPSTQHQYSATPHTRARLNCHLEASGAGWASDGCCSCRQTSHCQRASPWTNAGRCGTGTGLSSGGSADSGYLCPGRFPGKRGTGQCHLTCLPISVQPEIPRTTLPDPTAPLSPRELQAGQELADGSPGSRTAGDKSSHAAKQGVLGLKLFLQASLGSKGGLAPSKTLPPCNTVLGAGVEVQLGTKTDGLHLPGNAQSRQREGRS